MDNKILNPLTGRYVLKTGAIGKKLLNNIDDKKVIDKKVVEKKVVEKTIVEKKVVDKTIVEKKVVDKTVLTININKLKDIWEELYNKNINTNKFSINENEGNILRINISETEKIFGITGKDSFIIRKMNDIALSNNSILNIYIPKNYNNKSDVKPIWNIKHGYMYYKNDLNIKRLQRIIDVINIINIKYKDYKLILDVVETDNNKTFGIIGIDIKYDEPIWVTNIIKGSSLSNPIVNKNGEIIFSKSSITVKTIDLANNYLNKKTDKFSLLYPEYIDIKNTKIMSSDLNEFIESKYIVCNIGYDKHARILYKEEDNLIIIDPWKQTEDTGTLNLIRLIKNLKFIKRKKEQTNEGSCLAISYARALYLADKGVNTINTSIPFDYIILSSRLISKFRIKR
jgi:hypothetical protein